MKKISLLFVPALFLFSAFMPADEEKELKRPGNIGDASIDNYVNQCFDNYEGVIKTDKDLAAIEADLNKIEADGNKLKHDADILKRLYAIQGEIRKRDDKMKDLDKTTESMVKNAKNLKPATKAPKAVKNVNNGTKALKIAQEKTPGQLKKTEELISKAKSLTESEEPDPAKE